MLAAPVQYKQQPAGDGRYKYRNLMGHPVQLTVWKGDKATTLTVPHNETFEGTDAYHSYWLSGRFSLFFPDGRESVLGHS